MMDVTDRHCRYFLRQLAPGVRLYSEMLTAGAVLHGDRHRLLRFDPAEHPVAIQLAGREPAELAEAARIAADYGYDEVNLNVGCPSGRVRDGGFGACLMLDPSCVARCIEAMQRATAVPVSVKTRIGVDDHDSEEFLTGFVREVSGAGCRIFIVHARKAILQGLSPRGNRVVPPLRHDRVHRLKREFPHLAVIVNGGIDDSEGIAAQLQHVDGVMIGRKIADDPCFLIEIQQRFQSPAGAPVMREAVVRAMYRYACGETASGTRLAFITRHMLGLYRGVPGARAWRRFLVERSRADGAGAEVLLDSLALVPAGSS